MSSQDPDYLVALLHDGDPQTWAQFAGPTPGTDEYVQIDVCDTPNPEIENWTGGLPAGWKKTGTVTEVTGGGAVSGSAAQLAAGATLEVDITVRAGEIRRLEAFAEVDSPGVAGLRLYNPRTNQYLQTDGTWKSGVDTFTATDAAYPSSPNIVGPDQDGTFTVQTFSECLGPTTTLRIILINTAGSGVARFDNVASFPSWDFVSVHGHSIDPRILITLRSSTDAFATVDTQQAVLTARRQSFFGVLAGSIARRWARIRFAGANSTLTGPIGICHLVLGRSLRLARHPEWPIEVEWDHPQTRYTNLARAQYVVPYAEPLRSIMLKFRYLTGTAAGLAGLAEGRDELIRRARGGRHRIVLVPLETDLETVVFGTIDQTWGVTRSLSTASDAGIRVLEMPMALPVSL